MQGNRIRLVDVYKKVEIHMIEVLDKLDKLCKSRAFQINDQHARHWIIYSDLIHRVFFL